MDIVGNVSFLHVCVGISDRVLSTKRIDSKEIIVYLLFAIGR